MISNKEMSDDPVTLYKKYQKISAQTKKCELKTCITINLFNVQRQECLPSPLLIYILQTAKFPILQKLQKICKYFFVLHPIVICSNIYLATKTQFCIDEKTIFLNPFKKIQTGPKNLYITNCLSCYDYHSFKMELTEMKNINRNIISSLISRMYKCDVQHLYIPYQNLTLKEFEFLICNGNVKYLNIDDTVIVDENGKKVPHVFIQKALFKYRCQLNYARFW